MYWNTTMTTTPDVNLWGSAEHALDYLRRGIRFLIVSRANPPCWNSCLLAQSAYWIWAVEGEGCSRW